MIERIFYYFLKNIETKEEKIEITDTFIGDIGDYVFIDGQKYIINDYTEEWNELELPEDYNY